MALYKKLGAIAFYSESSTVELFQTQDYWLIQPKVISANLSPGNFRIHHKFIHNYNSHLKAPIFSIYSESNSTAALIAQKNSISPFPIQSTMPIEHFCRTITALISSLQIFNADQKIEKICPDLFFITREKQNIFYLHYPTMDEQSKNSQLTSQATSFEAICSFLKHSFSDNKYASYRLLITKLCHCRSLAQMQQEIEYFSKIYGWKIENSTYQKKDSELITISKHRLYRKSSKSSNGSEQRNKSSYSNFNKILNDENRKNRKNHKESSCFTMRTAFFFRNKNKSSQALHFDFDKTHRKQKSSNSFSKRSAKVKNNNYFFNSRNKLKNQTISQFGSSHKKSVTCFHKEQETCTFTNTQVFEKQGEKRTKNMIENDESRPIGGQDESNWMKEVVNRSLAKWQDKTRKKNEMFTAGPAMRKGKKLQKFSIIFQSEENDSRLTSQILAQKTLPQSESKQADQDLIVISFQKTEPKNAKTIETNFRSKNANMIDLQEEQKVPKPKQKSENELLMSPNSSSQKTTERKSKAKFISQQNSKLQKFRQQVQKYNLIGECVTKTPQFISLLNSEHKVLWQIPAFLLYKQFYIKRSNLYDSMAVELRNISDSVKKEQFQQFMNELKEQNMATKQSLTNLLKLSLKKVKKYQSHEKELTNLKRYLNLDYFTPWLHVLDEISSTFIITLEDLKESNSAIEEYQIQFIDAYLIARNVNFDYNERQKLDIQSHGSAEVQAYLQRQMSKACAIMNKSQKKSK